MIKSTLALALSLCAVTASAVELPWEDASPQQTPQYCTGFVVGGLASKEVSGMSRTDLWLAWNYVIRSGVITQGKVPDDFQSGQAQFQNVADSAAARSVVQQADGDCGLGRSGHQITGW